MGYVEISRQRGLYPASALSAGGLSTGMLAALVFGASGYAIAPKEEYPRIDVISLRKSNPPPVKIETKKPEIPPPEVVRPINMTPTLPEVPPLAPRQPDLPTPPQPPLGQLVPPKPELPPVAPLPERPAPVIEKPVHVSVKIAAVTDPRFAHDLQPAYPSSMKRVGKEGRVTVKILIGVDGRVKQFEGLSAPDPAFLDETRQHAIRKWRFKPMTIDGEPAESWKVITLNFLLTD